MKRNTYKCPIGRNDDVETFYLLKVKGQLHCVVIIFAKYVPLFNATDQEQQHDLQESYNCNVSFLVQQIP